MVALIDQITSPIVSHIFFVISFFMNLIGISLIWTQNIALSNCKFSKDCHSHTSEEPPMLIETPWFTFDYSLNIKGIIKNKKDFVVTKISNFESTGRMPKFFKGSCNNLNI